MCIGSDFSDWLDASLFIFTIKSLSLYRVLGGLISAVLVSNGEVFRVLFTRDGNRASLTAVYA